MMTAASPQQGAVQFARVFGHKADFVVQSPGRVNLIGDHVDYTGGLVLPMAVDRALLVAAGITDEQTIDVHSAHFQNTVRVSLESEAVDPAEPWSRYALGVIVLLKRRGIALRGARLWIGGDVPPGAGLASSAALEVGVALAMLTGAGETMPPADLAALCRQAEHEFADSPCGIMDQLCCTSAKAGHALMIDCRTEKTQAIPLNLGDCVITVIDSGVRHSIAGKEYAARRQECAAALERIQQIDASVDSLRDVTAEGTEAMALELGDTLTRRARHVVTENTRVALAVEALRSGDVQTFGRLMCESHVSLRDDFAVSCDELDAIVSTALSVEGVVGARMTGGGFGGCAIALTHEDAFEALRGALRAGQETQDHIANSVFQVGAAGAATADSVLP